MANGQIISSMVSLVCKVSELLQSVNYFTIDTSLYSRLKVINATYLANCFKFVEVI